MGYEVLRDAEVELGFVSVVVCGAEGPEYVLVYASCYVIVAA